MSYRNQTILIVEDEKSIMDILSLNLGMDGFDLLKCDNGIEAVELVKNNKVNLVIMDVMLPKLNGIDASKQIKKRRPELPIVMLSALDQSIDRIKGLKAGADDYVDKPFNYDELLLRIEKQLKRSRINEGDPEILNIGENKINLTSNTLQRKKIKKQLSSKEVQLLQYLFENRNRTISREELYTNVWGYESFPNSRTVDNYISSLRKILANEGDSTEYIRSERGVGYKLIIE